MARAVEDDEDETGPSLWEQLATEAVGALVLELPDPDDAEQVLSWVLPAPDSDGVCELDEVTAPLDVVDALLGGGDLADEVLDVLERSPWPETPALAVRVRDHFALAALPAGMWQEIVERVDLYGEAIEADLALGGVGYTGGHDLLDWFRGDRPWPQLLRLLERLPEGSRYVAAILDDEELARARIEAGVEPPAPRSTPSLLGETAERMLLRAVLSGLMRVEHAVFAAQVGKKAGPRPRPLPGPSTAEDRLREAISVAEIEDLFDQVTPHWRDQNGHAKVG
jgi:hypothetical protein